MADRVRTIGVLNGMPVIPVTGTGGYIYPIDIGLARIVRWSRGTKVWSLTTDFQASGSNFGVPEIITLGTIDGGSGAARERDLAVALIQTNYFLLDAPAGTTLGQFNLFGQGYRQLSNAVYQPSILVSGVVNVGFTEGTNTASLEFNTDPAALSSPYTDTLDILVDTETVRIYILKATTGTGTITATQLDFTPTEFWPYAGADTFPIYDTTTGALLPGRLPTD